MDNKLKKDVLKHIEDAIQAFGWSDGELGLYNLTEAKKLLSPKAVDGIALPEKVEFIAGEWVNSYGNTQQVSKIYVNGERVATIEVNGYGNQYEYDSKDWLVENGFLPPFKELGSGYNENSAPAWIHIRETFGIEYSASKTTFNRKKDLKYFGSY